MSDPDASKTTAGRQATKRAGSSKSKSTTVGRAAGALSLPQASQDEVCASYLKAIGDPLRMRIVRTLQRGPMNVSEISELVEQDIGLVSHHLRVLYHANVIASRREGKFIFYSLNDQWRSSAASDRPGLLDFGCCQFDLGGSSE